ncbi:MAG: oxidoreductase [Gemmatimonadota bacterium]
MSARWTAERIPDQSGRVAIVTGANAGLGLETARVLGLKGARVILASRNEMRATAALERLRATGGATRFEFQHLDLSALSSVRTFAERFRSKSDRLDLLINNAGVMIPPFSRTADGFELQFGVNYLGHFALTGLLFDRLAATPGSRVVSLSSMAHRGGAIDFESFTGDTPYRPIRAYQQSKLACLMFALELQKRMEGSPSGISSLGAHPGATKTELQRHNRLVDFGSSLISMDVTKGTLSQLYAATEPTAQGGEYIGPTGWLEARGYPGTAKIDPAALDSTVRERLWSASEALTGIRYP